MKKIILALLAAGTVLTANAQKGTILKYGDIGLDINNSTDNTNSNYIGGGTTKNTNFHVAPGFGYQFSKHVTIGLQGGYASNKTTNNVINPYIYSLAPTSIKDHAWGAGIFARYTEYIGSIFFMTSQINVGYIGEKVMTENPYYVYPAGLTGNASTVTANGLAVNWMPGVGVFVRKGWALNFNLGGIGYSFMKGEGGAVKNNDFSFNFGRQFNFGVSQNISCHDMMHMHHHGHHEPGDDMRGNKKEDNDD